MTTTKSATISPSPRPLGYGEQLWLRLSEVASNNALIVCEMHGTVDPGRLKAALRRTAQANPMLRARVRAPAGQPQFTFAPEPSVPWKVIYRHAENQWQQIAKAEIANPVRPYAPVLWRAILVRGQQQSELIISCNHAIVDGLSLQLILDQTLQHYTGGPVQAESEPTAECYEPYLACARGWKIVRNGLTATVRQALQPTPPFFRTPTNPRYQRGQTLTTGFRIREIDPHRSRLLLREAKRRGQSIHGVVASLFIMAARHAGADEHEVRTLTLGTALNARPKLTRPFKDAVGYFVTGAESRFSVAPDMDVWHLADRINRDVQRRYTADNIAYSVWLKWLILAVKRSAASLVKTASRVTRTNLHLTNLGRLNIQASYGDIQVKAVSVLPSAHFIPIPIICLESHFFNNKLHFGFVYPEPITDPGFVEAVVAGVEKLVHHLVAHSAPDEWNNGDAGAPPKRRGNPHAHPELQS